MKFNFLKSLKIWKDSAMFAFVLLAGIESIMSIVAISLDDIIKKWWWRLFFIVAVYAVLTILTLIVKYLQTKKEINLDIRGIKVTIKQGDIFKAVGWKIIPFNEHFETIVDDIFIAKNSLNGKLILEHLDKDGVEELKSAIGADDKSPILVQFDDKTNKWKYPLGRIKIFRDYMLLALTHFNEQNEAHTTRAQYEQTLRIMWQEISRTYANKPIFLPLIGTGITRFDDIPEKNYTELLRCILCTLRTSNLHINQPITILLTEEALSKINLYELKGV